MASTLPMAPPDREQRERALDATRSVLVRAPAGSGKTDLLTRRFLKLLGLVDDPAQVVAITFTRAAAAEMRHRIVAELEKASRGAISFAIEDEFSMETLAAKALDRSRSLGWNLLEVPSQLQISTIDSFCRELALQQPLLSGFGGSLEVAEEPGDLYRRAARLTLRHLEDRNPTPRIAELQRAIEALLLWRDNNWRDLEEQLVSMLARRDQWMRDFVLDHDPDWDELRARLERPFARAAQTGISRVSELLASVPDACDEALELARFACGQKGLHRDLAELWEFPCGPFVSSDDLDDARRAYACLADMLLTKEGAFRTRITASEGFPAKQQRENARMAALIVRLRAVPELGAALHAMRELPPARYTDAEWAIVRACFTLLRQAAAELKVLFAEAGRVDFVEVAQLAQHVLRDADELPSDAAIAAADKICHLLIDEFQDTSRRQHALVASLVAAWPDTAEQTLFVVGDPMQSIYSFREADAELFPRVQKLGLELPAGDSLKLDSVGLSANFRTAPELVEQVNESFERVFAEDDGSGVQFSSARAVRPEAIAPHKRMHLHLEFVPQTPRTAGADEEAQQRREESMRTRQAAQAAQVDEMVSLIRGHANATELARARGEKYRIAVLGRTRTALAPVAAALRDAAIPFRAVDLEPLGERPEVLDALALARAFLMPEDRIAWLGVLRAPWCGLSLEDLHRMTSGDDEGILRRAIPELLAERSELLSESGQRAAARALNVWTEFAGLRAALTTTTAGTLMEQVWLRLGGDACVDAAGRANVQLVWSCLDRLPSGEAGLLNGEMEGAIARLMAEPDPEAESDYGVQLMTIHKSKGLEFEVVIVPELQAGRGKSGVRMLSWMERGLAEPGANGEITEFLVAPVGPKGGERSSTKAWVDAAYRARETQEMRRILYVAATRAREELHVFARPEYKSDGLSLCEPGDNLLRTAWPALEDAVRERFEEWREQHEKSEVPAIAAQGQILQMAAARKPAMLRRLPEDFAAPEMRAVSESPSRGMAGLGATPLYRRHEGGIVARALGRAVHILLEEAAQLRVRMDHAAARAALHALRPRAMAEARSSGIDPAQAEELAIQAIGIAERVLGDPAGGWILMPHADATSEASWTGVMDGVVRSVRADRVFRAGDVPGSANGDTWWVIDYKTAHPEGADPAKLIAELRPLFAAQLETYAQFLRKLYGDAVDVRVGLYYPRLLAFDWWKP